MDLWLGAGISGNFKPSMETGFPRSWKAKSWSSPTTKEINHPFFAWIVKRGGPYGKRIATAPSPRLPLLAYRVGTAGKLQFVSNSKLAGRGGVDGDRQSSRNGPDTLDLRSVSSPVFAQGLFFASCGSGGRGSRLVAIRPPANPGQPPTIEYALKKTSPYVPTPLPFEDMLFLISDGGIASCLKTTTGETLWRERLEGNYFASPVLVNGKVCIVSREGDVRVLSITKEK